MNKSEQDEKFEYWLLFKYWAQHPYIGSPELKELRQIYKLDVVFHLDFENLISKINWQERLKKIKQSSIANIVITKKTKRSL